MTDTKMCPYCGEDVKLEAIKCKHCQSMLSEEDDALVGARSSRSTAAKQTTAHDNIMNQVTSGKISAGAIIILATGALAVLSMFMKWVDIGFTYQTGLQQGTFLFLLFWVYPVVAVLTKKPIILVWGTICAVLSVAATIFYISSKAIVLFGETLLVAGTGSWLFLFLSILLFIGILTYRPHGYPVATSQKGWVYGLIALVIFSVAAVAIGLMTSEGDPSSSSPSIPFTADTAPLSTINISDPTDDWTIRNISIAEEWKGLEVDILGIAWAEQAYEDYDGKLHDVVTVNIRIRNTRINGKFTVYPDQGTLVTSTGEQVSANLWESDSIGGELYEGVTKEGVVVWPLEKGQVDSITWVRVIFSAYDDSSGSFSSKEFDIRIEL